MDLWTLSGPDNPGEPVPEGTFRHLLDFLVQNEDNTGRRVCIFLSCFMFIIVPLCYLANLATIKYTYIHTVTPSRLIGALTSTIPTILRWMPFLTEPSLFILAWDRHQICWLAYPVATTADERKFQTVVGSYTYLLQIQTVLSVSKRQKTHN